jgi:adapter protein MecA 1/2
MNGYSEKKRMKRGGIFLPSKILREGKVEKMEIERINENTVKFYISYVDIEERGFDREEIWYNREKSEELFWEMMDEVHEEEDFTVEGPLWIQVQALEKGLEVVVTKAQFSKDGNKIELSLPEDKLRDLTVDSLLDQEFSTENIKEEESVSEDERLQFVIRFQDFEHLVSLAHRISLSDYHNSLYSFDGRYYLFVEFADEDQVEELDNALSILLEYGDESQITIYRLQEYGKEIISENALSVIAKHFPVQS